MPAIAPFVPLIAGGLGLLSSRNAPEQQTVSQGGRHSGGQVTDATSTAQTQIDPRLQQTAGRLLQRIYEPGGTVAPLNYTTQGASQFIRNQLGQPLGTNPFATGGMNQFASGGGINPYLDNVFDTAAGATQNRLASEFARAGRYGSGANQQARSQELQTLAANIYGPGFEAERQRQFGATEANLGRRFNATEANLGRGYGLQSQALGLAPSIGGQIQARNQAQADRPSENFNQTLTRLGSLFPFFPSTTTQRNQGTQSQSGFTSGSQTTPLYNDPFSGFAGGALLGSALTGRPVIPSFNQPYKSPVSTIDPYGFGGGFGGYGLG